MSALLRISIALLVFYTIGLFVTLDFAWVWTRIDMQDRFFFAAIFCAIIAPALWIET